MSRNELVAGLDIGTTKTCCVIAEVGEAGDVMVTGVGVTPSAGMKRGVVVDIESTVHAVEEAVSRASRQAGRDVQSVYVGVSGDHISSLNSRGVTAITHSDREINHDDIERVKEQSRVIVLPPDRIILHAIPRSFAIDGQNGIRHPAGMSGTRLEVETHIVTGARTFIDNVEKCVSRAGIAIEDMVLEPLATGEAIILSAERNLGVCMVDIGGGTTDIAVFQGGSIYYSAVVPVGGSHVTNDIAQLFRMSTEDAESLKIESGTCLLSDVGEKEVVKLRQIGGGEPKLLPRRTICEVIEARMEELFQLVGREIMKSGCHDMLPAGIVLTGGGSQLGGAAACAATVLDAPVRLGKPTGIGGLADSVNGPEFSTGVGLVMYGAHNHASDRVAANGASAFGGLMRSISGLFSRLKAH